MTIWFTDTQIKFLRFEKKGFVLDQLMLGNPLFTNLKPLNDSSLSSWEVFECKFIYLKKVLKKSGKYCLGLLSIHEFRNHMMPYVFWLVKKIHETCLSEQ